MTMLSHNDITVLLVSLAVLLGTARILGEIATRLRQPSIIGELIAGIVLGPTILGTMWPAASSWLFPAEGPVPVTLHGLTTLAITLFLLVAGLEVDLSTIWRRRTAALYIGLGGMVVPFLVGFVPAWLLPTYFGASPESSRLIFALFIATAMSISALPVVAKMLMDLQLFRTDLGMTIVAAAVLNDLLGWMIFAVILAMIGQGAGAGLAVWQTLLLTLAFVAMMLTVGRWLIDRWLPWILAHTGWPGGILGFAMTLAIACAAFTEWIGVHAIFGAFIFGVALGDSRHLRTRTRATLDQFISFIFAPLFFASIGLRIDFVANFDLALTLLVLVIATVGKVVGCTFFARKSGMERRESLAVGFGMNARGAMEIILGLIALEAGLISERLFVALVIMALITSISSGSLMQLVLGSLRRMQLLDFVTSDTFVADLKTNARTKAISQLARIAAEAAELNPDDVEKTVLARERLIGSAVGNCVAIPNARIEGLDKPCLAVGISRSGIDFDAPDGQPVKLIVLMLTPAADAKLQLELLGAIARSFQLQTIVDQVVEATNWTHFLAIMRTHAPPEQA